MSEAEASPATELPEEALQVLTEGWKIEQKIVEEKVQVYKDPTPLENQNHDRISHAEIVEDTEWCKILRPSYLVKGGSIADNDNCETSNLQQQYQKNYHFGGVDVGWPNPPDGFQEEPMAVAVYVVIDVRTMKVVYKDHEWISISETVPYVSTFLSFREIDPLERLVKKQLLSKRELTPSAILVDGNGTFHPRHSGIACFLGVRTGIPTIGIGKTLLYIGSGAEDNNPKEDVEDYQWTRRKLDERIDGVLVDLHRRITEIDSGLQNQLKKHKGLILPKRTTTSNAVDEGNHTEKAREELLKSLKPFCNGIAIPLEAPCVEVDDRFRILGTALIGQGGKGSKKPIIVSVGHKLSQVEAVSITASLSLFRIPEPVRVADLYGRDLLRERKML